MADSVLNEVRRADRAFDPKVILDIGANIGQTALDYRQAAPKARIHCIEPVQASVDALTEAVGGDPLTSIHRFAMGREDGTVRIRARGTSTSNKIMPPGSKLEGTEEVPLLSGASFCAREGIAEIDYLKVDAEGHDLEVLRGFEPLLRERRVDYLQAECGLSPDNTIHVTFQALWDYLTPFGYRFFGLHGVSRRNHRGGNVMMRGLFYGNAIYVRERL